MPGVTHQLDNPVWYSLSETQANLCVQFGHLKCYQPDYAAFAAFDDIADTPSGIASYAQLADKFFVVGEKPILLESERLEQELVCLQMICEQNAQHGIEEKIIKLGSKNWNEMSDLVNLVMPGYYKSKTAMLGDYFGIFQNDRLVAVTGERMKMNGFTEISAVVTHPDHVGKGYARQLIAHTMNGIFNENQVPFLHVAETNTTAIHLYEKLGFAVRRKMSFWKIVRVNQLSQ